MGKTVYDEITIAEQSSSPGNPPSGFQHLYPKTDGKIYAKDSSGNEYVLNNLQSIPVTEVEINFGSDPVTEGQFTIVDATINPTMRVMVFPSGAPATDRVGNDFSWETFSFSAVAGTGSITVYANCSNGSVVGKRNILYTHS